MDGTSPFIDDEFIPDIKVLERFAVIFSENPDGDTGFHINLGQVSGTLIYPSAGIVEQNTNTAGVGWNFGSETFGPYTLTDTFGGTVTQCVNGWVGQTGSGAHVTSTSNNPAQDTFAYG